MIRVNLVLLLAVLASAMYLVSVQYESRRIYTELDKAKTEAHRLATEYERLKVEKGSQATPARVERLAREKLQMRHATPATTTYVTYYKPVAEGAAAEPAPNVASQAAPITTVKGGIP
jgi:cell division protein FtsL